jgi:hypothetical protein
MALLATTPSPYPTSGTPFPTSGNPFPSSGAPLSNSAPAATKASTKAAATPAPTQSIFGQGGAFGPTTPTAVGPNAWSNPSASVQAGAQAATATVDPYDQLMQALQSSGPYTPAQTIGGGSSVVQTGPGLQQIMSMLGLGNYQAPTLAQLTAQANNQVNTTLNPQIAAVQQQIAARNTLGQQQSGDATKQYADLNAFIQAATQQGQGAYENAANAQGQDYQALLNGIGQNYANGKQAVNAEQARLGLNGINNSAFDRNAQFLQGLAAANQQSAANTLAGQRANYTGTQNLLGSAEQSGGVAEQNKLATALAQALGGLNQQVSSLQGSRGGLEQQALAQLQQQALTNQNANTTQMLNAIKAAAAGQKVVSNGSTKIAASGISDQQKITDALAILSGQRQATTAQQNAAQKLITNAYAGINSVTATTKEQQALAGTPALNAYNQKLNQIMSQVPQ